MVERATTAGVLPPVDHRQAAHALIGMTSWLYKWFEPGRDNAGDVARSMIRLVLGTGADGHTTMTVLAANDAPRST